MRRRIKLITIILVGFSFLIIAFNMTTSNMETLNIETPNTEQYGVDEVGRVYIENEWLAKVADEEEAIQIATSNNLLFQSISEYGIAKFYGDENYSSVLVGGELVRMSRNLVYQSQEIDLNDPDINLQYGLEHIYAEEAWTYSTGEGILVAVIDTGIDINHDEFAGKISPLSYNSYFDEVGLEAVDDDYGHGTMVSGVILASQNNLIGISGLAPNAQLLTIKANEPGEGLFNNESLINAVYYAVDHGANVINMSLAGEGYDEIMNEAMEYAASQGVIVVCAAGNDGTALKLYPAGYDSTISVASTDENNERSSFSNFHRSIDIAAPGSNIYTTSLNNGYATVSGTSLSSPFVAGNIALLMSYYPDAEIDYIKERMYATAIDLGQLGKDSAFGYGMIHSQHGLISTLHTLSFDTFDGTLVSDRFIVDGETFYVLDRPYLEGYHFVDWYKDTNYTELWDFTIDVAYEDMTLYAKYEEGEVFIPEDYEFVINIDHTVSILSYYGTGGDLIVPSEIYGYPVTEIQAFAFSMNDNIVNLTIPDSIKKIGYAAMLNMVALQTVNIGSGLETMEEYTFAYCEVLETVYFEDSVLTQLPSQTFFSDVSLSQVRLPNSVIYIGIEAFLANFALTSIVFPENLQTIDINAFIYAGLETLVFNDQLENIYEKSFAHNLSLKTIEIPASLSGLGDNVFIGCSEIANITVDPLSTHFLLEDDILYDFEQKQIILYSPARTAIKFIVPQTIENIRGGAFTCAQFEEIEFNDVITTIPSYAFYNAKNLKSITLPENITSAEENAFDSATALSSFHFSSDFEEISYAMFSKTVSLKKITFSYNLKRIEMFSFMQSGLEELIVPETVEFIGEWAFAGCYILENVSLPNSVIEIQDFAFYTVGIVNIPTQLEALGNRALPLENLDEVILPETATDVGEFLMERQYSRIRYVDFGGAKNVYFNFYSSSRLQTMILGENTETAEFWGTSEHMIHLFVYSLTTEIVFKNEVGYNNYIIHGLEGSTAESFADSHSIPFISLTQTTTYKVNISVDGPAQIVGYAPEDVLAYDIIHFSLNVSEEYMVYSVKVNGQVDENINRHYYYCVDEDINIEFIIKPINYVLDYEYITIESQMISGFGNTNSEFINLPSYDESGLPILGFKDDIIPLIALTNTYAGNMFWNTQLHTHDILHISFSEFMTHIPAIDKHYPRLQTLNIPEGVLTMDGIEETTSLQSIILPSTLTEFPHWIDENDYTRGIFTYCFSLEYVLILSEMITEIPNYAFYDAMDLKQIVLPSSISSIGAYAFRNSPALKEVVLGNPNVVIDDTAFMFHEYAYIFTMAPFALPEEFRKLPDTIFITPEEGLVTDYANKYFMPYRLEERVFITYLNDDGSIYLIDSVLKGEDAVLPVPPKKRADLESLYAFSHWDIDLTNIESNIIAIPIFDLNENLFRVRFFYDNGNLISEIYVSEGQAASAPENTYKPSTMKYDYSFIGWDKTFDNITFNLDVNAMYESTIKTYLVRFLNDDGALLKETLVEYGQAAVPPENPTKAYTDTERYGFSGWDKMFDYITNHIDIYAVYEVYHIQAISNVTYILSEFEEPITIKQFSFGQYFSLALDINNQLYGWGNNDYGQLAIEDQFEIDHPVNITSYFNLEEGEFITQIATGDGFTIVLTSNYRLFTLGYNECGQLGDGTWDIIRKNPVDISDNLNLGIDEKIIKIIAGSQHVIILTNQYRIFTWGSNWFGQLGNGDTVNSNLPIDITNAFSFGVDEYPIMMDTGYAFSGILTNQGRLILWGGNDYGQLGIGNFIHQLTPIDVTSYLNLDIGDTIDSINFGESFVFILTSNHKIYAWGSNYNRMLTIEEMVVNVPTNVTGNFPLEELDYIVSISCGYQFVLALSEFGNVYSWGNGSSGQTGNNNLNEFQAVTDIKSYFNLPNDDIITFIYAGNYHAVAVTQNKDIYSWGFNGAGQVGNYGSVDQLIPTKIMFQDFDMIQVIYNYGDEFELLIPECPLSTQFLGWYYDYLYEQPVEEDFQVTGDTILFAKWETLIYFEVKFIDVDGTLLDSQFVISGMPAIPPENPVKQDTAKFTYTFACWDKTFDNIINDLEIYATYTSVINEYSVKFYNENGTLLKEESVAYGSSGTAPTNPTKATTVEFTYTFDGWDVAFDNITTDLTVTAIYTSVTNQYTVTFYDEDGTTLLGTSTVDYGTAAIAPVNPTKAATVEFTYTFGGWDVDYINITADLDVIAVYIETKIVYIYSLSPGIDTIGKGNAWIDSGITLEREDIDYVFSGIVNTDTIGVYEVTYTLMIDTDVIGELTRIVTVIEAPLEDVIITLNPGISTLLVGETYVETNAESNLGEVIISGAVNTTKVGVYMITYQVVWEEIIYEQVRFVIVYSNVIDLTNINAVIPQMYRREDE